MTFEEARAQFPVLERIAYLNAGTFGPMPRAVLDAVRAALQRDAQEGRSGLPYFDNGYPIGTTPNWMPLYRRERSYTFSTAVTKVYQSHDVRLGVDVVRHQLNHIQAEFGDIGGVRGGFRFNGTVTGVPGYTPQLWNSFGTFLLGRARAAPAPRGAAGDGVALARRAGARRRRGRAGRRPAGPGLAAPGLARQPARRMTSTSDMRSSPPLTSSSLTMPMPAA